METELYESEMWVSVEVSKDYGAKKVAEVLEPVLRRHLNKLSIEIHEYFPDAEIGSHLDKENHGAV
jgi:hypothetical protein